MGINVFDLSCGHGVGNSKRGGACAEVLLCETETIIRCESTQYMWAESSFEFYGGDIMPLFVRFVKPE